jgi:hypothetical protein
VILLPLVSIGDCDLPTWSISEKGVFNCEDTWEVIRHRHRQVQWWKLIWFSLAIPRQAFFMWLAIRDSLTTGESLLKWVFGGNALCGIFFFFFLVEVALKVGITYFLSVVSLNESGWKILRSV